ncbi:MULTISPECIES: hypothetical protein [unclassified Caballeronia]|uniref:hypothetical protein n=1 Tax=unclassified Caballeronia TaxID=2646786 RepID=UPI001F309918|nr:MULTISPECIES: hypothetical protein [unclassified Caballeronia]MCE4541390.1 hypothetical protein [Caballeronia sp. PC1]MCE4569566.1 hypothetical protein [Caballeronia sp. CLC5]
MNFFSLGMKYRATMSQPDRKAAVLHAQGAGTNCGNPVTVTVKDADGNDVVLKIDQDEFIAFLSGFSAY